MIKKTSILLIAPNFLKQKTSYNFGNLHIDDYMFDYYIFENWEYRKTNGPIACALHLVSARVLRNLSQESEGFN